MNSNEYSMNPSGTLDSAMNFEEALTGLEIPESIKNSLQLVTVGYSSFDGELHEGQLIIHKNVAAEISEIFDELLKIRYPFTSIIPMAHYGPDPVYGGWDDEKSMSVNNTSAFNYRPIFGTDIVSNHSRGLAIDINPLLNPCTAIDGTLQPANGVYDLTKLGTLTPESEAVKIFTSRGWRWLGFRERKDWQHFDKADAA
jgi:peptidoglycan L-alanyl-D-glutamate endopeptidase CwlK